MKEKQPGARRHEIQRRTPAGADRPVPVSPRQEADRLALQQAMVDPESARPADVLALQRVAGNQAVSHLIQTKLTVGPADDHYEREAERVAEQVVSGQPQRAGSKEQGVQRQPEEEEIQTKPLADTITRLVQRQPEEEEIQTRRLQRQLEEEEIQTRRIQRQPEEEEIQTRRVQRQPEEEEIQTRRVQRQPEEEEIQTRRVQRQPEEEEIQTRRVQRQPEEEEIQTRRVQRQPEEEEIQTRRVQRQPEEEEIQTKRVQRQPEEEEIQTKSLSLLQRQVEEEEIQTRRVGHTDPPGAQGGAFDAGEVVESRLEARKGSGEPLPGDTREFMESRFGTDLSNVRLHTDAEAADLNRSLNAQAFTHGHDIYMPPGKLNGETDEGKRLLAHELTHVVQQTGRVQPRIQRWSISSWGSKRGHETITAESVKEWNSQVQDKRLKISNAELKQLEKGARWNDLLGHWGVVTMGMALTKKSSLAHQSHEGQLQFLHGMAANEAEEAWKTQHKIMLWAEFCFKIATGEIKGDEKIGGITLAADRDFGGVVTIAQLFDKWKDNTVSWLFTGDKDSPVVGLRALGSMMHMLQDTFCASHTQRVAEKRMIDETRKIRGFNVYTQQSASLLGGAFSKYKNRHGIADKLKEGDVQKTAGAKEAATIGARVMGFAKQGANWGDVVKPYLQKVFALTPELEAQKPQHGVVPQGGPQTVGKRIVSSSGRQFRKKWLSDEFKSDSKIRFSKRPAGLKVVDQGLKFYEALLKVNELDTVTDQKDRQTRKTELQQEGAAINAVKDAAQTWLDRNRATEKAKRVEAVTKLLAALAQDKKEIDLDLASIDEAQEEEDELDELLQELGLAV
ncbi:MAG: DUF4157 domain-containing protein [Anaerolineae bacterium]|nr:DUF4157 domain-containing protein [Anaerolineae bacterium]